MHYKITITRTVPNPNYKEELEVFKDRSSRYGYGQNISEPQLEIEENSLFTILNEEQFAAVRKACVEAME